MNYTTGSVRIPYMKVRRKAHITSKGQITLPADVRRTLGVGRGDAVVFEVDGNTVVVVPDHTEGRFAKFAGRFRIGKGRTRAETVNFVRALRDRSK